MFNDHYVVIAQDCVGSDDPAPHEASMFLMRHRFDLATGVELAQLWQRPSSVSVGKHVLQSKEW